MILDRSHGIRAALRTFMVGAGFGEPSPDMLASMEANADFDFFFVHYIVGLAKHEPDIAGVEGWRLPHRAGRWRRVAWGARASRGPGPRQNPGY